RLAGNEIATDGGHENIRLTALSALTGAQKSKMSGILRPGRITVAAMTTPFRGVHLRCMRRVVEGGQHKFRTTLARAHIGQHGAVRRNCHGANSLALAQSLE